MQSGTIERHGKGWRGRWRENGGQHATRTVRTRGEAQRLLTTELRRIELGDAYRAPITYDELCDRFLRQHHAAPVSLGNLERRLRRSRSVWGSAQAGDVSAEAVRVWLREMRVTRGRGHEPVADAARGTRYAYVAAMRQVYRFGVQHGLVKENPAATSGYGNERRSEHLHPFTSWREVERVAEEMGRWAPLVVFAADTGARPAELTRLAHGDVDTTRVRLPGTKTRNARRVVHLTDRGRDALTMFPRSLSTMLVWHHDGAPLDWEWWRRCIWHPGLRAAGVDARAPYSLRHTFALFSLQAGVPIADLSVEMGHASIATTSDVYGHWADEMGERAAALRGAWASRERAWEAR